MIKKILCSLIFTAALNGFSQLENYIKFNETTHEFGNIKEEKGDAKFDFIFTNVSKQVIFIRKVETSCGCTTPKFNTDSVLPGAQGKITAIYETENKSGNFHKFMYVYFNISDNFQSLAIKGDVTPIVRKVYQQKEFTVDYGNLAYSESVAQFNTILNTEVKEKMIKVYNYNPYPIKILEINELPDFASIRLTDSTLNVSDSIKIYIKLDGSKIKESGDLFKRIGLLTDDETAPQKLLYIRYSMKEDFSKLTKKQLKKAPKAEFNRSFPVPLGTRTAGEIFKDTIRIINTGKTDLVIKKVIPSCSCLRYKLAKTTLKPGESALINLNFDIVNQPIGEQKKFLKIFTNDPSRPEIDIPFTIKIIQ